jgi:hypothetical protein
MPGIMKSMQEWHVTPEYHSLEAKLKIGKLSISKKFFPSCCKNRSPVFSSKRACYICGSEVTIKSVNLGAKYFGFVGF